MSIDERARNTRTTTTDRSNSPAKTPPVTITETTLMILMMYRKFDVYSDLGIGLYDDFANFTSLCVLWTLASGPVRVAPSYAGSLGRSTYHLFSTMLSISNDHSNTCSCVCLVFTRMLDGRDRPPISPMPSDLSPPSHRLDLLIDVQAGSWPALARFSCRDVSVALLPFSTP
jgi:hypothetical protein